MTVAYAVMNGSQGGVTFEEILDMTFPELVEHWEEAQIYVMGRL